MSCQRMRNLIEDLDCKISEIVPGGLARNELYNILDNLASEVNRSFASPPVNAGQDASPKSSVLLEAEKLVNGERRKDYGTPYENHSLTATYWSIEFGYPVSAEQVCKANILQKLARSKNAYKRDNYVDIAGYAENANQCRVAVEGDELPW